MTQDVIRETVQMRARRRPFGLKAIMTLLVLQVIAGIAVIGFFVLTLNLQADIDLGDIERMVDVMPFYVAQQSLLAVLRLICALGLWRLKRWAWFLMMLLLSYSMAVDIIAHFGGQAVYLPMLLNVIMVFYLNQREVQELFAKRSD